MVLLKFKNSEKLGNYDINILSASILWLESNHTSITYLIKPIEEIANNDKYFMEKFIRFFNKNEIEFPNEESKIFKKMVNEIFYIYVDQIMSYLLEDIVIALETKEDQKFIEKIPIFLNVIQNFRILNNSLKKI
jgi:hypothetical protein